MGGVPQRVGGEHAFEIGGQNNRGVPRHSIPPGNLLKTRLEREK